MTHTEDALVEQPAIQLFSELNWETTKPNKDIQNSIVV
jgi:type I restriction enzyme R subunit